MSNMPAAIPPTPSRNDFRASPASPPITPAERLQCLCTLAVGFISWTTKNDQIAESAANLLRKLEEKL